MTVHEIEAIIKMHCRDTGRVVQNSHEPILEMSNSRIKSAAINIKNELSKTPMLLKKGGRSD